MSYIYPVWVKKGEDFEFFDPEAVRIDRFEGDNLVMILMKSEYDEIEELYPEGCTCGEAGKYSYRTWGLPEDEYSENCITKAVLERVGHPKQFKEFTLEGWVYCDWHVENAIGASLHRISEVQLGEDL